LAEGIQNGMADYETLLLGEDASVLKIVLNRPGKRNALTRTLIHELSTALDEADAGSCRAVILTGAGSAFCAGMDLGELEETAIRDAGSGIDIAAQREDSRRFADLLLKLYFLRKPTICAVNGATIAGGLGLAAVCDFTLAVPEAKFGYTEARIGFIPAIVTPFLVRQAGEKRARELLLTARIFSADEALSYGLLTRIVAGESLHAEAMYLAQGLLQNSPDSLAAIKSLLKDRDSAALLAEIEIAIEANAVQRGTRDFKEGLRAFLEKRPPVWTR
jgi:methylglutaconyl-CoA hydratase